MNVALAIKQGICLFTALIGLFSVVSPKVAGRFIGFGTNISPRGISEIRAVVGGAFVALGIAPFILPYFGFEVVGLVYLAIAIVRSLSIAVLEKDFSRSNVISAISEWVMAAALLLLN
jgi:hypothetical protein